MRRYLIPIFFLFVSVGVYIFYIDPTLSEISILRAKEAQIDSSIQDAAKAADKIAKLTKKEKTFPENYEQNLHMILPDTIDSVKLLIEVDAMASARGLHISTPQIGIGGSGKKGVAAGFVKHTITFSLTAPYNVFRTYLRDLESSLSLRDMSNVTFSTSETNADATRYVSPELVPHSYGVNINTYSLH
jgi:Tfp pilus assembly protein PilO